MRVRDGLSALSGGLADGYLLISWPITPPTAAPPTVPKALPPVRTAPPTAPTPAPMAVFLSCLDIPAHPLSPMVMAMATTLGANLINVFMMLPLSLAGMVLPRLG